MGEGFLSVMGIFERVCSIFMRYVKMGSSSSGSVLDAREIDALVETFVHLASLAITLAVL